ncbi:MAG: ComF family protein [Cytophagales bacterium]|nr:ComF family protein [Cytophagales bacterium]
MNSLLKIYIDDFLSLIYPKYCAVCDAELNHEPEICTLCRAKLPFTQYHEAPNNPLYLRLQGRLQLQFAIAFLKYSKKGKTQKMLQKIKYGGNQELICEMGKWYGQILAQNDFAKSIDVLLPVPLHKKRLAKRGYNQSMVFCEGLAQMLHCNIADNAIIRKKNTQTQTRKTNEQRWDNVSDIFELKYPELLNNKKVTLVDDVITTGATLEALGIEVLKAKPASLAVLGLAVAL